MNNGLDFNSIKEKLIMLSNATCSLLFNGLYPIYDSVQSTHQTNEYIDGVPRFPIVFWDDYSGSSLDDIMRILERILGFLIEFRIFEIDSLINSPLFLVICEILFQIIAVSGALFEVHPIHNFEKFGCGDSNYISKISELQELILKSFKTGINFIPLKLPICRERSFLLGAFSMSFSFI